MFYGFLGGPFIENFLRYIVAPGTKSAEKNFGLKWSPSMFAGSSGTTKKVGTIHSHQKKPKPKNFWVFWVFGCEFMVGNSPFEMKIRTKLKFVIITKKDSAN